MGGLLTMFQRRVVVGIAVAIASAAIARGDVRAQAPRADALWQAFWRAESPGDALKQAHALVAAGVGFDEAWTRLKHGRAYPRAATGERGLRASGPGGVAFDNYIDVPAEYDPARPWPVRVQLHGGVDRSNPEEGRRRRANRIVGEPQIYVHPFGWAESAWWHASQVDNVLALVDRVKRLYNVDESRIYLTGTSDGATGAFFLAMREPTLWSSVLPLIGHLGVLANPSTGADGDLFVSNLVNRPFFVVNGAHDPLYPAARVAPYLETLYTAGVPLTFRVEQTGGHDTSWWDTERPAYEAFVRGHPRVPHPTLLSWETERTDRYNRVQWLVIDELGVRPSDVALADANTFAERYDPDFGLRGDSRKERGTRVVEVVPESDAAKMGLRVGDKLIAIDGAPATDEQAIVAAFNRHTTGPIAIVVERDGGQVRLSGPFPPEAPRGPARRLFQRRRPSGRVDVERRGNAFVVRTRGVARFRLLLSPDAIDFARPVAVTVNGRALPERLVTRDPATLLTWAARDNDRTMLYGAEWPVSVP